MGLFFNCFIPQVESSGEARAAMQQGATQQGAMEIEAGGGMTQAADERMQQTAGKWTRLKCALVLLIICLILLLARSAVRVIPPMQCSVKRLGLGAGTVAEILSKFKVNPERDHQFGDRSFGKVDTPREFPAEVEHREEVLLEDLFDATLDSEEAGSVEFKTTSSPLPE